MKAEIAGLQVLESGCFVSHTDSVTFYPINEDYYYALRLEVAIDSVAVSPTISIIAEGSKTSVIRFVIQPKQQVDVATASPICFAVSDSGATEYLANIALRLIGIAEASPTYSFSYTILARSSS